MENINAGMQFCDLTRQIEVSKTSDLFVDDTAKGVSPNNIHDGRTALEYLSDDEQKHAYLLYSTGHLLALYNCLFHYYFFVIKSTKFVHSTIAESPGELLLHPKYGGHEESIKRLKPHEAHKTLGCRPAVNGSQECQFKMIKSYIKKWTRKIQSAPLSKADKIHAYRCYLEKKLLYVLPTCSFTFQQCAILDKLLSSVLFNCRGFQRNCNRSAMYLTDEFEGLKIMPKIQFLCIHSRTFDTTRKLLQISRRCTQLECGLYRPFLKYNFYSAYFLVTPTWTTNIWQYMTECHTQLHYCDPWVYECPRESDFFLMDIILRANIPQSHKEIFNRVRLVYLQLLTSLNVINDQKY